MILLDDKYFQLCQLTRNIGIFGMTTGRTHLSFMEWALFISILMPFDGECLYLLSVLLLVNYYWKILMLRKRKYSNLSEVQRIHSTKIIYKFINTRMKLKYKTINITTRLKVNKRTLWENCAKQLENWPIFSQQFKYKKKCCKILIS